MHILKHLKCNSSLNSHSTFRETHKRLQRMPEVIVIQVEEFIYFLNEVIVILLNQTVMYTTYSNMNPVVLV